MSAAATIFQTELRKALQISSLNMRADAFNAFCTHLTQHFSDEYDPSARKEFTTKVKQYITQILTKIKEGGLSSSTLEKNQMEAAINSLTSSSLDISTKRVIDVIPAFNLPRFHYDSVKKTFHPVKHDRSKFGLAEEKADMLRSRYELLLQRLQRLPLFTNGGAGSTAMVDSKEDEGPNEIVTIESLMGSVGKKLIFGQLSQLEEGRYSLEDIQSHIDLNLNSPDLKLSAGLFTEGGFVLVEGVMKDDKIFHVDALVSPLAESRQKTLSTFPQLDWLESDIPANPSARNREQQMKIELLQSQQHHNDMIVVLSDVHLDNPQVLVKIAKLLEGLQDSIPPAFIFCGNFTSKPFSNQPGEFERLKAAFDALADVLGKFGALCRESHFIFIPGPNDLPTSMASILPTPSLPTIFLSKLKEKLVHVTFGSNPCRVSWITKEICIFREDLLHKLHRNCIRPPSILETTNLSEHLVKTVIDQAHLCPLPMEKRPIYWNYDHTLRLYPLPDALILADCVEQYEWPYENVLTFNPGTFSTDFSFVVYYPAQDKSEFSRVKD